MKLEKIRAALPTHIMLTPGVHRWREGDEQVFCSDYGPYWSDFRGRVGEEIPEPNDGLEFSCTARRPIPPHILDNQAFYLWAGQYGGVVPTWENDADVRKHIEKGRLYDKWLLEQMDDV